MIGSLLRFSSGKDGEEVKENNAGEKNTIEGNSGEHDTGDNDTGSVGDDVTDEELPEASSDAVMPEADVTESVQAQSQKNAPEQRAEAETGPPLTRGKHFTLDELGEITRRTLADEHIEVSKVKPFIWSVIEAYTDRFQSFPFDASKALFNYLEINERPGDELKELVRQIELLYEKQQGEPMRDPEKTVKVSESHEVRKSMPLHDEFLDDELKELRETLKYAAMVGERLDDTD